MVMKEVVKKDVRPVIDVANVPGRHSQKSARCSINYIESLYGWLLRIFWQHPSPTSCASAGRRCSICICMFVYMHIIYYIYVLYTFIQECMISCLGAGRGCSIYICMSIYMHMIYYTYVLYIYIHTCVYGIMRERWQKMSYLHLYTYISMIHHIHVLLMWKMFINNRKS